MPPQEPVYHFHIPEKPRVPPLNVKEEDPPLQMKAGEAEEDAGGEEVVLRVTEILEQDVVLQEFSALTK